MNEALERHSKRNALQDRVDAGNKSPHDFVERWEIEQMIQAGVSDGLERYEVRVVMPRHAETQSCLRNIDTKIDALTRSADKQSGGIAVLQWVIGGGGILGFLSLGLGLLVYLKH